MKLDGLTIAPSPLTDRLYLGKAKGDLWQSKSDCTSRFLGALVAWVPPGTIREFSDNKGNRFEVEVRQLKEK